MKEKIKNLIKGDVEDSASELVTHSRDASLFEIKPELVVYPKDIADVSSLVKFVAEEKKTNPQISITARSAGTCMSGGSLNNSISLDCMRYLNHLDEIKDVSSYEILPHFWGAKPVVISGEVQVEPGVYYHNFEPKTLEKNLLLPCFTASKSINAIGGMIGNNSGGELSLKYGKTQDYVREVEVVFADGTHESLSEIPRREAESRASRPTFVGGIYRDILKLVDDNRTLIESKRPHVSKNSAGYNLWNVIRNDEKSGQEMVDLSQLIVGSQGTLGITVGAKLRLVKTKKESAMLVVYLYDLNILADLVDEALKFEPETIETYDDKSILLAVRFWKGFIKMKGIMGFIKMGINFLPEFFMLLGGMPKMVLLIECTGDDKHEVLARIELLQKRLSSFKNIKIKVAKNKEAGEKYWMIRHDSFNLLRQHVKGKRTAPFIDDVIVPPEKLPEFIPAIRQILDSHKLNYSIAGHGGNGNFHIIPLIDTDERKSLDMILEVSEQVYALVIRMGGSITGEHNDGIIRTPYLPEMFGDEMIQLFTQVKKIFDPQNIFNPGKKVGLTKADIGKYLIRE